MDNSKRAASAVPILSPPCAIESPMMNNAVLIDARFAAIELLADEMKLFELAAANGQILPPAEPGAHIDVHLPSGLTRQYSLVNSGLTPDSYKIGVKREADGQGASRWLHDEGKQGAAIVISAPRNHFPLHAQAHHSILIAGGIGITPIFNMAQQLHAEGKSWELHYGCRSRAYCAFHEELLALDGTVRFYFDDQLGPGAIDFAALASKGQRSEETHLYCCGPPGMLVAYERACADLPEEMVHLEHFAAPRSKEMAVPFTNFVVELARSGREITVPASKTILECLSDIGIDVPYSCGQGVCGSCETRVLEGKPDHRDVVLSTEERASNQTMMICCSRAHTQRLKLDL